MAFNPFKAKPPVEKPNRNAFDLSFANNLTLEFGKLYPVFCKECLPGDTFRIKPTFGFRFMPMYFPVQSRMRADLKFFYVRNRNLWDNWKKFIGQTDRVKGQTVVPPYLNISPANADRLVTGSLLDYFGVPTTAPQLTSVQATFPIGGNSSNTITELSDSLAPVQNGLSTGLFATHIKRAAQQQYTLLDFTNYGEQTTSSEDYDIFDSEFYQLTSMSLCPLKVEFSNEASIKVSFNDFLNSSSESVLEKQLDRSKPGYLLLFTKNKPIPGYFDTAFRCRAMCEIRGTDFENNIATFSLIDVYTDQDTDPMTWEEWFETHDVQSEDYYIALAIPYKQAEIVQQYNSDNGKVDLPKVAAPFAFTIDSISQESKNVSYLKNPFVTQQGASGPVTKLSALPLRAYEAIFNSFYRNIEVDGFRINQTNPQAPPLGTEPVEYDKFIPVSGDGADAYPYNFHYQYWEHDFLTDALPQPQMGVAPLVGGRPSDSAQLYNVTTGAGVSQVWVDSTTKQVLSITPNQSNEEVSNALSEAIQFGISINDFRNTNALQKWLEKNVRRGYRYKDQMLSHFGVSLSYEECDMPEYIGGISEDVNVRAVSQSVGTADAPLGSLAGQASCVGSSKYEIDKYTDEHGFIIGILCITPIPTYSQLLPKHFLKDNALDYFTPEFGHIGYQPVPVKEVAPLNVIQQVLDQDSEASDDKKRAAMEKVFGYQRAWYDYLSSVDEVHGEFRTTMRDYLVDRVFEGVPELSKEFLEVQPSQINDIFNYQGSDDKVVGQMWFDTTVVRPIPKYGLPKLD